MISDIRAEKEKAYKPRKLSPEAKKPAAEDRPFRFADRADSEADCTPCYIYVNRGRQWDFALCRKACDGAIPKEAENGKD